MSLFPQLIQEDLRLVEDALSSELLSSVKIASDVSKDIVQAGGKRLRPSLVILSAKAVGRAYDIERLTKIAACAEIAHMATLMHDDVVDEADSRRGKASANARWGNQVSVLSGDFMVARVFSILAKDGDPEVMRYLSDATIAMTEGELRQLECRNDIEAQKDQYLSIIQDKTAMFMSACCRLGAVIAGVDAEVAEVLAEYGLQFGMAFQVADDILDLVGDPAKTGKPVGGDIREGKVTMPVIFALQKAEPEEQIEIERILRNGDAGSSEIAFIRMVAERTGALDQTRKSAARFVAKAIDSLSHLPESEARACLAELAEQTLTRNH